MIDPLAKEPLETRLLALTPIEIRILGTAYKYLISSLLKIDPNGINPETGELSEEVFQVFGNSMTVSTKWTNITEWTRRQLYQFIDYCFARFNTHYRYLNYKGEPHAGMDETVTLKVLKETIIDLQTRVRYYDVYTGHMDVDKNFHNRFEVDLNVESLYFNPRNFNAACHETLSTKKWDKILEKLAHRNFHNVSYLSIKLARLNSPETEFLYKLFKRYENRNIKTVEIDVLNYRSTTFLVEGLNVLNERAHELHESLAVLGEIDLRVTGNSSFDYTSYFK
jgi:hypothetical protein